MCVTILCQNRPYQDNPPRYQYALTPKGLDLRPAMAALREWGLRHVKGASLPQAAVDAMAKAQAKPRRPARP